MAFYFAGVALLESCSHLVHNGGNPMVDHLSFYRGLPVLVTGGAGAIGSNLSRRLAELEAHVCIVDDLSAARAWNVPAAPDVRLIEGDILDEATLRQAFAAKPALVFHLAAFFANQHSVDDPERDLMVNGMGTLRLLQSAVRRGSPRIVYASSGSVYGGESPQPLAEENVRPGPATPYQATKYLGELYCEYFHRQYSLEVTMPRLFGSYGPGEIPGQYRNVIANFMYWALKGHPLPITGTGSESRDFTYVGDIVDGLLRVGASSCAVGQELNLASGVQTTVTELAERINHLTGNPAGVEFCPARTWDNTRGNAVSLKRASALVGYSPAVSLEKGLALTLAWFRANWEQIESSARFPQDETADAVLRT